MAARASPGAEPTLKERIASTLIERGLGVVAGFFILLLAHFLGQFLKAIVLKQGKVSLKEIIRHPAETARARRYEDKQLKKTRLLFVVLGQIVYFAVMIVAVMIVMRVLGIEAASLIALLGAAGFAVGLAFQGVLSDFSAGILLAVFQTYSIGDIIEVDGIQGRVMDFNMVHTVLLRNGTNTLITIPNRSIMDSAIENHTRREKRSVVIEILASNKNKDFNKIMDVLKAEVAKIPEVLTDPAPVFGVSDMSQVGTQLVTRVTIKSDDYPAALGMIRLRLRQALADANVELVDPF